MFRFAINRRAASLLAFLGVAVAGAAPLLVPGEAWADKDHWRGHDKHHWDDHGRGRGHHKHHKQKGDKVVINNYYGYDDRVVMIQPPPRVVVAPPMAYAPPPQRRVYAQPACDYGWISNELGGNLLGGVAGGVIGNQFGRGSGNTAATIGGAIVGTLVGGSVGRSMDMMDRNCAAQVLAYAPDNRRVTWVSDDGDNYAVQPLRSWQSEGRYCREYQTVAKVGGRSQSAYGQACMQPDGSWEIVN